MKLWTSCNYDKLWRKVYMHIIIQYVVLFYHEIAPLYSQIDMFMFSLLPFKKFLWRCGNRRDHKHRCICKKFIQRHYVIVLQMLYIPYTDMHKSQCIMELVGTLLCHCDLSYNMHYIVFILRTTTPEHNSHWNSNSFCGKDAMLGANTPGCIKVH